MLRKPFRTDERAWIVIDEISVIQAYPADNTSPAAWKYAIYAKNVDKTIARDVRIHIDQTLSPEPTAHGIYLEQMKKYKLQQGKPIGPDTPGAQSLAPGARTSTPVIAH
jgi:hypothetical protein